MSIGFGDILQIAGGAIAGAVVALKFIAPKTSNKVDDRVLRVLENIEKMLGVIPAKPTEGSTRPKTVDHRST